ncbi:MBL fold metallo-hydrolase [Paracoccus sp. CPCC 101403]|uniref:MBL fold metallo-hydrolase n=2 Tax=Paracoccus broussonetiae TaxID=3075834 RepID=A0ABU3EDA0_9RHOB|nr:MBL fold metallo-hydrolase [Paracoccus sp. CPCC 101403]
MLLSDNTVGRGEQIRQAQHSRHLRPGIKDDADFSDAIRHGDTEPIFVDSATYRQMRGQISSVSKIVWRLLTVKITQVRNATLRIDIGKTRFLIDPYLAEKGTYEGFAASVDPAQPNPRAHVRNPTAELSVPLDQILAVDAVIVTHTHADHWDEAAIRLVPKRLPIFVQNEADAATIRAQGFEDVRVLGDRAVFEGVTLTKTPGQHGSDDAHKLMGDVMGVLLQHPDEKRLYVAGDTVWNDHVEGNLAEHAPQVVVVNAGDARIVGLGAIIMGVDDVKKVCEAAPDATVIASHMEAVNHAELTREALRTDSENRGYARNLLIPADGETISL